MSDIEQYLRAKEDYENCVKWATNYGNMYIPALVEEKTAFRFPDSLEPHLQTALRQDFRSLIFSALRLQKKDLESIAKKASDEHKELMLLADLGKEK